MKEKLKEIRKAMDEGTITREEVIIELFEKKYISETYIDLGDLDFSNYEGDIYICNLKAKKKLWDY